MTRISLNLTRALSGLLLFLLCGHAHARGPGPLRLMTYKGEASPLAFESARQTRWIEANAKRCEPVNFKHGRWPSDHFPVLIDVTLPECR